MSSSSWDPTWASPRRRTIDERYIARDVSVSYRRSGIASKGTRRRESRQSQVFYVPDPPAWSSPPASPSLQPKERAILPLPNGAYYSSQYYDGSREVSWSNRGSELSDEAAIATSEIGVFTPPPTPRGERLQTPDLEPLGDTFCNCKSCRRKEQHGEKKSKVDSQLHAARQHIMAASTRREASASNPGRSSTSRSR